MGHLEGHLSGSWLLFLQNLQVAASPSKRPWETLVNSLWTLCDHQPVFFPCCLWQESVVLLCQDLCGLALVVASQDRMSCGVWARAEGAGCGRRAEGSSPTRRWAWLSACSVRVESCEGTSLSSGPQHKSQGPPSGSFSGSDLHLAQGRLLGSVPHLTPKLFQNCAQGPRLTLTEFMGLTCQAKVGFFRS